VRKAQERGVYFEERVVWKYFAQICLAIRHMHARRIMHRDLKPANIFLTLEGQVKVGDLGLGRSLSEDTMVAHSKVSSSDFALLLL
jgi:NIMA (never in mitosis gene a)-related kinase 7